MANSSKLVSCVVLGILAMSCLSPHSCEPEPEPVPLFVFGDSLYDVGINNYINTSAQANFPPYGETFFKFPTGRFSDGRVIPDFIAEYANLPLILPYLYPGIKDYVKGVNFASGGAGALDQTFPQLAVTLRTQLGYFKEMETKLRNKLGTSETKKLLSRAVYLIAIGGNDYGAFDSNFTVYQSYTTEQYVDSVIGNMSSVIKGIYKMGGRKFSVLNVGPMDRLPAMREAAIYHGRVDWVEQVENFAVLHNQQLPKALQKLQQKLKGFIYSHTDFYTALNDIIDNPTKYGIKEVKSGCCGIGPLRGTNSCGGKRGIKEYELCGNPEEYVFFDATHLTHRAYQIIAQIMWTGTSNITTPLNVKSLFYI
ncbi:GDSL esterase/lipase 1-like [Momordica charantia]|uniref:GDSL esterase/lipase 1-like n=1 Tax=Momordica charantia TaxID=3673 RepID=A0A6J1E4I7_MOMCH|nr:GDSL esterase/lipase 1-like [Momordica charantia]